MSKYLILIFLLSSLFTSFGGCKEKVVASNSSNELYTHTTEKNNPVLVELFTSEGCSSCPPADNLITLLSNSQPIANAQVIVLSEHVDYWNYLGWKDSYSSEDFTRRQYRYAQTFNSNQAYTPQMVINGKYELVGNNKNKAFELIAKSAKEETTEIKCRVKQQTKTSLELEFDVLNLALLPKDEMVEVMLAITEDDLDSDVTAGENARQKLHHIAVVRNLGVVGEINKTLVSKYQSSTKINLSNQWNSNKLKVVLFLQGRTTFQVFGVTSIKI